MRMKIIALIAACLTFQAAMGQESAQPKQQQQGQKKSPPGQTVRTNTPSRNQLPPGQTVRTNTPSRNQLPPGQTIRPHAPGQNPSQPNAVPPPSARPGDNRQLNPAVPIHQLPQNQGTAQQQPFTQSGQAQQASVAQVQNALSMFVQSNPQQPLSDQQRQQIEQAFSTVVPQQVPREFVVRFVDDLSTHLAQARLEPAAQARLATAFTTVLSPQLPPAQLEQALGQVQSLLTSSGLSRPAARTIVCDLHLIAAELQPHVFVPLPR